MSRAGWAKKAWRSTRSGGTLTKASTEKVFSEAENADLLWRESHVPGFINRTEGQERIVSRTAKAPLSYNTLDDMALKKPVYEDFRKINYDTAELELQGAREGYALKEQTVNRLNDTNMDMSELQLRGMREGYKLSPQEEARMVESRAKMDAEWDKRGQINRRKARDAETLDQRMARVRGTKVKNTSEWVKNQSEKESLRYEQMIGDPTKRSEIANYLGIDVPALNGMNSELQASNIRTIAARNGARDPSLWDSARYHKVPEAALGVGVMGSLVLGMSGNRGRQTNGQLYGQQ